MAAVTTPGYIQVPTDSTGKKIASIAVTLVPGTVVINQDGTQTTLVANTVVYAQAMVPHGLVSDAPEAVLDGVVSPLSLTNDGRLRVSSEPARRTHLWFNTEEEAMWKELEPTDRYYYPDSPWAS
jgi:hypothetical protein